MDSQNQVFRQIVCYLAELFRQIVCYLAELFRQIVCYLAELFRQIAFPYKNTGIISENTAIFMPILVLNSQKRCQYLLSSFKTSDD